MLVVSLLLLLSNGFILLLLQLSQTGDTPGGGEVKKVLFNGGSMVRFRDQETPLSPAPPPITNSVPIIGKLKVSVFIYLC